MDDRVLVKLLSRVVAGASDMIFATATDESVSYVNPSFCKAYGYEKEEILGRSSRILWEDANDFDEIRELARESPEGTWAGEFLHRRRSGESFPAEVTLSILADDQGKEELLAWVCNALREDHRLETALTRLARVDGLTSLAHRGYFEDVLDMEWRRAKRNDSFVSVILVDIDWFSAFNGTYGFKAGDGCLKTIAAAINALLNRPGDLAARHGGEEFAVLLPGTNRDQVALFAETIRARIEALGIPHQASPYGVVTASLGVASAVPGRESRSFVIISSAETALREAKQDGRNRVTYR